MQHFLRCTGYFLTLNTNFITYLFCLAVSHQGISQQHNALMFQMLHMTDKNPEVLSVSQSLKAASETIHYKWPSLTQFL